MTDDGEDLPQIVALTDFEYAELTIDVLQRAYIVRDLLAKTRDRRGDEARMVAMYLVREITERSYPWIADAFKRDHSTVISACGRVEDRMRGSDRFTAVMARFAQQIDAEALRKTNEFPRVDTPEQPTRWWRKPSELA